MAMQTDRQTDKIDMYHIVDAGTRLPSKPPRAARAVSEMQGRDAMRRMPIFPASLAATCKTPLAAHVHVYLPCKKSSVRACLPPRHSRAECHRLTYVTNRRRTAGSFFQSPRSVHEACGMWF